MMNTPAVGLGQGRCAQASLPFGKELMMGLFPLAVGNTVSLGKDSEYELV